MYGCGMEVTLAWYEIATGVVGLVTTAVSTTLYIVERRKTDNTKHYMALQGLLRACDGHAQYLSNRRGVFVEADRDVSREEYELFMMSEYATSYELREHIMGAMKSLQPDQDIPFDVQDFLGIGAPTPARDN